MRGFYLLVEWFCVVDFYVKNKRKVGCVIKFW